MPCQGVCVCVCVCVFVLPVCRADTCLSLASGVDLAMVAWALLLALVAPRASGLAPALARPALASAGGTLARSAPRFTMAAAAVEQAVATVETSEAVAPKPALSKRALLGVMAFTAGAADTATFTKWGSYANMSECLPARHSLAPSHSAVTALPRSQ